MEPKLQAQAFYLQDALSNYFKGNYAVSIALCKVVLVLDSKNVSAKELLQNAELALNKVQNLTVNDTE
jgi:hypothetical protein